MKTKNEYIEILATQLREWSAEIDQLTEKTEKAAALVKLNYVEELNALHAKQQVAQAKLAELEESGHEGWEALKDTADKVWDDLKTGLAEVAAKLK
ncbi:coiled coil domain-containing protein [Methylomonas rivi]|uniref:Coiled coil domain-containing protein n=1 Tax=Methylomonas rivi TaxID=2952226 RepID=A0ABT1U8I9_9GAMM|nr:coiled coil domain-containing protein [Methylomonas sp. WSC-6]MBS4052016.1 coiled coil domain-containing protein [Methylomonas sp.]MCQ8130162.1 coiled coil domain-containing protein [Methylomonas sp. WSC-6]